LQSRYFFVENFQDSARGRLQRIWVDSSPSNGLISVSPYAKIWGSASTAVAGDVHFYDYNCDCEDYRSYPEARFVSEFGFQSMPSFLAYKPVTIPTDWDPDGELMKFRQRHENGNEQIRAQMEKHFLLPSMCEDDGTRRYYDMYLYLSGVQQSRCYETAVNRWRQLRSKEDIYTMGVLYWQHNDIWQGPSWSGIEWGGRWKPLHSSIRRAFSPLAVTFSSLVNSSDNEGDDTSLDKLSLFVVNDNLENMVLHITVDVVTWKSAQATTVFSEDVSAPMLFAFPVIQDASISTYLNMAKCSREECYIRSTSVIVGKNENGDGMIIYPSYAFLTNMKSAAFSMDDPGITVADVTIVSDKEVTFTVAVALTSPFLFFEMDDIENATKAGGQSNVFGPNAGWFSDNNFLAEAHKKYTVKYTSFTSSMTLELFQSSLRARTLQFAYNCDTHSIQRFV
jgi:hypothetical protein